MQQAASLIQNQHNFFAFSKSNTQVKNFQCNIIISEWHFDGERLYYIIEGNRFLRGMVRLLTGSLLQVGRRKLTLVGFEDLFNQDLKSGYAVPSCGLFLERVVYPKGYFE